MKSNFHFSLPFFCLFRFVIFLLLLSIWSCSVSSIDCSISSSGTCHSSGHSLLLNDWCNSLIIIFFMAILVFPTNKTPNKTKKKIKNKRKIEFLFLFRSHFRGLIQPHQRIYQEHIHSRPHSNTENEDK